MAKHSSISRAMDESVDQYEAGRAEISESRTERTLIPFPVRKQPVVAFDRKEMSTIMDLYGRFVASGEWRDYGLDFGRDRAVFAVFRRAAEQPLYRIVKDPALNRKQGAFAVLGQAGQVLKRGHDLQQVLRVLIKNPKSPE